MDSPTVLCSISWRPHEPKFSLVEFEEINTHMSDVLLFLWIVFYNELTLGICFSCGTFGSVVAVHVDS